MLKEEELKGDGYGRGNLQLGLGLALELGFPWAMFVGKEMGQRMGKFESNFCYLCQAG